MNLLQKIGGIIGFPAGNTACERMGDFMGLFDSTLLGRVDSTPRHIDGISCDARNCVYHDGDNYCTAKHVSIGSMTAASAAETRCATFEARSGITRKN